MSNEYNSELFKLAMKPEFGFVAKHGGSIDIIAASPKAASAANEILGSLNHVAEIAKHTGIGAAVSAAAALATYALSGDTTTAIMTLGAGGMAGATNSIFSKGGKGRA